MVLMTCKVCSSLYEVEDVTKNNGLCFKCESDKRERLVEAGWSVDQIETFFGRIENES